MTSTSTGRKGLPSTVKLAAVALIALALFVGLVVLANSYNYSTGTRTGIIDKLSTKGFICWTMEGQLALPNFSKSGSLTQNRDTIDNTFYFSVPDKKVQKELEAIPPGTGQPGILPENVPVEPAAAVPVPSPHGI